MCSASASITGRTFWRRAADAARGGSRAHQDHRLSTAVTVLSSDDPCGLRAIRDARSSVHGRAEIMAGRGSFIESFPLFGYGPQRLRRAVRREARTAHRDPRPRARHFEAAPPRRCKTRRLSAHAPQDSDLDRGRRQSTSAVRAGTLGLPMALAIIGGMPERFAAFRRAVPQAADHAGHDPGPLPVGINTARLRRRHLAAAATNSSRATPPR